MREKELPDYQRENSIFKKYKIKNRQYYLFFLLECPSTITPMCKMALRAGTISHSALQGGNIGYDSFIFLKPDRAGYKSGQMNIS